MTINQFNDRKKPRRKLQSSTPETLSKRAETRRAVEAVDAMHAAKEQALLRKPPLRSETQMRTAGAIALASDKKHGAYDELRPIDFALEHPYRGGHDGSTMLPLKVVT